MTDLERDGSAYYGAPLCICASRNQRKVAELLWDCLNCGRLNCYRVTEWGLTCLDAESAAMLDTLRAS